MRDRPINLKLTAVLTDVDIVEENERNTQCRNYSTTVVFPSERSMGCFVKVKDYRDCILIEGLSTWMAT